jgi:mono/diheme cytochrome c family protein
VDARRSLLAVTALVILAALAACGDPPPDPDRVARVLELEGDADAGGPVYERVCQECHDADGAGKSRTLSEIVPASTDDELANVVAGGGHVSTSAMTEQEAADLIAYLRATWPG